MLNTIGGRLIGSVSGFQLSDTSASPWLCQSARHLKSRKFKNTKNIGFYGLLWAFGVVKSPYKVGFCGQILTPDEGFPKFWHLRVFNGFWGLSNAGRYLKNCSFG